MLKSHRVRNGSVRRALVLIAALLASAAAGAAGWWYTHRAEPNAQPQQEQAKQVPEQAKAPQSPGQDHIDNANEALENEDYDRTLNELEKALPHFAEDAETRAEIYRL